jgi:hypothetical protein
MATSAGTLQVKVAADITSFVQSINQATAETRTFARETTEIGRSFGGLSRVAGDLSSTISTISGTLGGMGGPAAAAAQALSGTASAASTLIVTGAELSRVWGVLKATTVAFAPEIAVVGAVIGAITLAFRAQRTATEDAKRALDDYRDAIKGLSLPSLQTQQTRLQGDFDFVTQQIATARANQALQAKALANVGAGVAPMMIGGGADMDALISKQKQIAGEMYALGQQLQRVMPTAAEAAKKAWDEFISTAQTVLQSMRLVNEGATKLDLGTYRAFGAEMDALDARLQNTTGLTREQVNAVAALAAEYRKLVPVLPKLGAIGPVSIVPSQRTNPNIIHGAPTASDLFKTTYQEGPGRKEISEKTDEVNHSVLSARDAIVTGFTETINALATLGGALVSHSTGGMIGAALGSGVGSGIGNYLGGKLGAGVGAAIGSAVLPVVGTLLGSAVGSFIGNGIGSLFGHKKAADNATDSLNKLAVAAQKVSESISNAVVGFKVQYYRYLAADATRIGVPVGLSGKQAMIYIAEMNVSAASGQDFIAQLSAAAQVTVSRGGAAGFTLAAGAATRGY